MATKTPQSAAEPSATPNGPDGPDAPDTPGAAAAAAAPGVPGVPDETATIDEGGEVVPAKSAARLFVEKACSSITQRMRENERNQVGSTDGLTWRAGLRQQHNS